MTDKQKKKLLHCHFCEKSQAQVKKLIAGTYGYICNECVVVCVEILAEVEPRQGDNHA